MKTLIFVEMKEGSPVGASLELFSAAAAIGAEADAVCVEAKEGGLLEDAVTDAVAKKAAEGGYALVLLAATPVGKLVTARIAARLGAASVNDAIALKEEGGKLQITRPVYGGTIQETLQVEAAVAVVSVRGGSYAAPEAVPEIAPIASDAELRARVVEVLAEAGEAVNLEDAKVIVTGGRGLGKPENFALLRELADALGGAAIGASRAAVDAGWISAFHQVGQTGKTVRPKVYIACGVSGQIQHLVGMNSSDTIIAINKDPDAPIFGVADIGIVGDLFQVVPEIIRALKA